MYSEAKVEDLMNKIITKIGLTRKVYGKDDQILFICEDGTQYLMYHSQGCYEEVYIEDICGDLDDIVGSPILMAEESTNGGETTDGNINYETFTWTFYKFATIKGYVTIRWYGRSNGCYAENAELTQIK